MQINKVLVTGASGFIGRTLSLKLAQKKYFSRLVVRKNNYSLFKLNKWSEFFYINNIESKTNWSEALKGINSIIHCASANSNALAITSKSQFLNSHMMSEVSSSYNLAQQAALANVRRFIFLSTIKVNGEKTTKSSAFTNSDIPKPENLYSISKFEIEKSLWEISNKTGLEVVIIRPPLVYGEGVRGNFLNLLNLVYRGIPLPFSRIDNYRSLVGVDNLVDLITTCIEHPRAAGKTFLISDDEVISTPHLIIKLAKEMKKKARLFAFPLTLIRLMGKLIRKSPETERLLGSLIVDSYPTKQLLNWKTPFSLDEGLKKTVKWYLHTR
jgi:nucleoside-diphosphate-sugar epimerase